MLVLNAAVVSFASLVLCAHSVHERRADPPAGFVRRGPVATNSTLELQLVLPLHDFAGLERELAEVSTPGSLRYGEVLSQSQVHAYMRPNAESPRIVQDWLSANAVDVSSTSTYGDTWTFQIAAGHAQALFHTAFSEYEHVASGRVYARALEYSLPDAVAAHVVFVGSAISFPELKQGRVVPDSEPRKAARAVPGTCPGANAVPKCVQDLYGVPSAPARQTTNFIGVAGFNSQYAHFADLSDFLVHFRPDMPSNTTFAVESVAGGINSQSANATAEASFDIQWTVGLATGIPVTYYPVGSTGGMVDLFYHIGNLTSPPKFLSVSYSSGTDIITSSAAAQRGCAAAAAVAARGTILFLAAGDAGVTIDPTCSKFRIPLFASCPYVVAVGWTQVTSPETPSPDASGGFSENFARPSWQDSTVGPYISSLGTKFAGKYNATGRGIPDISAVGYVRAVINGVPFTGQGSSFSAPLVTSLFALLNDELVTAGLAPLPGNLGPTLYQPAVSAAFTDVTTGSNPGANCAEGYPAGAGWDAASGLGTPSYPRLRQAFGLV